MNETTQFIRHNIGRHKQFALGTVDEVGNPWVVCLNLTYDEKFNIIWKSMKDTQHSRYLRANPNVAICIFSEDETVGDFGLYIKAIAHEVEDEDELRHLIDVRFRQAGKPVPSISEFQYDAFARIYYAETQEAWVNDDHHIKTPVNLDLLRA